MQIIVDDLGRPEVIELLQEHVYAMKAVHKPTTYVAEAFNVDDLMKEGITFWTIWDESRLAGCGALKDLGNRTAELKSMRTVSSHLRKGVASRLLNHIVTEARSLGFVRLYLETGAGAYFAAARQFYSTFGFSICAPFDHYVDDPLSLFMELNLLQG